MVPDAHAPDPHQGPLVLYDGLCGFCDVTVQWLLAHDTRGALRFAPLQGPTAAAVLARHTLPDGLDSIVLVEQTGAAGERVSWYAGAIFRICGYLPAPWRAAAMLRVLPRGIADLGYRGFAAIRFRIWGRRDACRVPTPAERARFLP